MQQDLFYEERRLLTSATDLLKRRKFQAKHSVGDGGERLPIVYIGTAQVYPYVNIVRVSLVLYINASHSEMISLSLPIQT